ncbi:MAG TPA: guanitoxin biosynthesis heme-dependent pre-guanitoxin N-hydroxylase GntA [Chthoniobacterales bacterium]|nr:guanitoxin biosynthesis heme-dependent pre-guanitoxin N-hydroxylase GntA [Chthoniobacterales bacterium]
MKGICWDNCVASEAATAFRELVMHPEFSCLGAKAAFNQDAIRIAEFGEIGTKGTTESLSEALLDFARSSMSKDFSSFVAIFRGPLDLTEKEFETCLWLQLRQLHEVDRSHWSERVSADPNNPHFSFSFGGEAFYVIGLHAHSSRVARRFRWPTLVFNPHEQFERLRNEQKWKRMQEAIRERELALQGSINPMLSDFGDQSEARQYSGREVAHDWAAPFPEMAKCPFGH